MAEAAARTEPATPARHEEARRRGDVAESPALAPAAVLMASLVMGAVGAPILVARLRLVAIECLTTVGPTTIEDGSASALAWRALRELASVLAPLFVVIALVGLGVTVAQVGVRPSVDRLAPDPARLTAGWRRLATLDGLERLVKTIVELAFVLAAGWCVLRHAGVEALDAAALPPEGIVDLAGRALLQLGLAIGAVLVLVAAADYAWARWRRARRLATTRDELREEIRRREGDPRVRARVRRAHRTIVGGSASDVARADVVLTSPGEVAVALRYRADEGRAPRLLAAATGALAGRMTAAARVAGIPIVARPELARAIRRAVSIGSEVPPASYAAVADVLARLDAVRAGEAR
jgi:flagellar biosynthetic protein FlhB